MDYYIDIRALPSPELSNLSPESANSILMNELFSHLHKQLVMLRGEIGVSFPKVNKTLGEVLRLHGQLVPLQLLMAQGLGNIGEYFVVSKIAHIPENVSYRIVKRVQAKSNVERLIRRSVRKGWLTKEEAEHRYKEKNEKNLSLPYLRLKSQSTGQIFFLFVDHGPILTAPTPGEFTSYGLSSNGTIPWF